jgi:hypothetical protein
VRTARRGKAVTRSRNHPLLALHTSLVDHPGDARLLGATLAHPLAEPFDRADVHPLLPQVLARHVDLGLLASAAEGDVGALTVGLPAGGEDARGLRGDALALLEVDGVAERPDRRAVGSLTTQRRASAFRPNRASCGRVSRRSQIAQSRRSFATELVSPI